MSHELKSDCHPLTNYYVYLTASCNLRCKHCWISPSFVGDSSADDYLDVGLFAQALEEGLPLGLRTARVTGGEPLLHPQFMRITDLLTDHKVEFTLETNGTIVDRNIAQHLVDKTSMHSVSVSLDGATAEIHDAHRGVTGSFEQACSGIRHLVEAGHSPGIVMSLHRNNVGEIEALVALAQALGCAFVKFNLIQPSGRAKSMGNQNLLLGIEELIRTGEWVEKDLRKRVSIFLVYDWPRAFRSIASLNRDVHVGCNLRNSLGLLSDGSIALCGIGVHEPDLVYGLVGRDRVADVWTDNTVLLELRKKIPADLEGVCGACFFRTLCLGYCVAQNYHAAKCLTAPYWFCQMAKEAGLFPSSRLK